MKQNAYIVCAVLKWNFIQDQFKSMYLCG